MPRWPAERLDRAYYLPGVELPIFYGDLDPNNHVNNVAVGRFFEQSRVEVHRHHDIGRTMRAHGVNAFVVQVNMSYLHQIWWGQPLYVATRIGSVGRSSFVELQAAWQGDTCVALCETTAATVSDDVSAPLPDALRDI
ncbi:MAG TPA: acyl-CoA thioesterase, partial [Mycobacteriales bacterium]|nr:acyl-CoA thioesterase [Mycobacteriales bacterium]